MKDVARRTAVAAAWLIAWRFLARIIGFASTLVLARLLVPADFGVVAMASTFAAAIDALSQIGLQAGLVRHPRRDRSLFDVAFTIQLGRAVLTGLVLLASAPLARWWFGEPRMVAVLAVLAFTAVVEGFENIAVVEFKYTMNFTIEFRLLLIARLVQFMVTIVLAFLLRSYWAMFLGALAGKLARTIASYLLHPYRPRLSLVGWRELAGFSFWTWASWVAGIIWSRGDATILGPALGPASLGLFVVGGDIATLPSSELIMPVGDAIYAGFAAAGQDGVEMAFAVAGAMTVTLVPMMIAISAAAPDIVALLLGPKWTGAVPVVAVLAWTAGFQAFSVVGSAALVARGMVKRNFHVNALASAIKLIGLCTAIAVTARLGGIAVFALAVAAIEAVTCSLVLIGCGQREIRPTLSGLVRTAIAGAGAALAVATLPKLPPLAACVAIGAVATTAFAILLGLQWWLLGRPSGPEERVLRLVMQNLPQLRRSRTAPGTSNAR